MIETIAYVALALAAASFVGLLIGKRSKGRNLPLLSRDESRHR